jgi:hypothetical protein
MKLHTPLFSIAAVLLATLTGCAPQRVNTALPSSTLDRLSVARIQQSFSAAFRSYGASPLLTPASTFCLAFRDSLQREFYYRDHEHAWVLPRPVRAMDQCPRTYAWAISRVDGNGRPVDAPPRGHVDPHRILVDLPRPVGAEWTVILRMARGMTSWVITCVGTDGGRVRCLEGQIHIS